MQSIYTAATVVRLIVRRVLAVATVWMLLGCVWTLMKADGNLRLATLFAITAGLAFSAWKALLVMERRHEAILAKHLLRTAPAPRRKKDAPAGERPATVRESAPRLVAQPG